MSPSQFYTICLIVLFGVNVNFAQEQVGNTFDDFLVEAISTDGNKVIERNGLNVSLFEYNISSDLWDNTHSSLLPNIGDFSRNSFSFYRYSSDLNYVIIGNIDVDQGGVDTKCQARVYSFDGNQWSLYGNDICYGGNIYSEEIDISEDGKRMVVHTPASFHPTLGAIELRVFEIVNNQWVQIGSSFGNENEIAYGRTSKISGNGKRVVLGTERNPSFLEVDNIVCVYEYDGGGWSQVGDTLRAYNGSSFGRRVSVSDDGNRIAIGAPEISPDEPMPGFAEVYEFDGTNWIQMGQSLIGDNTGDRFGEGVQLSGDGSRLSIESSIGDYIKNYEFTNGEWIQLGGVIIDHGMRDQSKSGEKILLSSDHAIGVKVVDIDATYSSYSCYQSLEGNQVRIHDFNCYKDEVEVYFDIRPSDLEIYNISLNGVLLESDQIEGQYSGIKAVVPIESAHEFTISFEHIDESLIQNDSVLICIDTFDLTDEVNSLYDIVYDPVIVSDTCGRDNYGEIYLNVEHHDSGYFDYDWSGGGVRDYRTHLSGGTYYVTITDTKHCGVVVDSFDVPCIYRKCFSEEEIKITTGCLENTRKVFAPIPFLNLPFYEVNVNGASNHNYSPENYQNVHYYDLSDYYNSAGYLIFESIDEYEVNGVSFSTDESGLVEDLIEFMNSALEGDNWIYLKAQRALINTSDKTYSDLIIRSISDHQRTIKIENKVVAMGASFSIDIASDEIYEVSVYAEHFPCSLSVSLVSSDIESVLIVDEAEITTTYFCGSDEVEISLPIESQELQNYEIRLDGALVTDLAPNIIVPYQSSYTLNINSVEGICSQTIFLTPDLIFEGATLPIEEILESVNITATECGLDSGIIDLVFSNGINLSSIDIIWTNGSTSSIIQNLASNFYHVTVTDLENCIKYTGSFKVGDDCITEDCINISEVEIVNNCNSNNVEICLPILRNDALNNYQVAINNQLITNFSTCSQAQVFYYDISRLEDYPNHLLIIKEWKINDITYGATGMLVTSISDLVDEINAIDESCTWYYDEEHSKLICNVSNNVYGNIEILDYDNPFSPNEVTLFVKSGDAGANALVKLPKQDSYDIQILASNEECDQFISLDAPSAQGTIIEESDIIITRDCGSDEVKILFPIYQGSSQDYVVSMDGLPVSTTVEGNGYGLSLTMPLQPSYNLEINSLALGCSQSVELISPNPSNNGQFVEGSEVQVYKDCSENTFDVCLPIPYSEIDMYEFYTKGLLITDMSSCLNGNGIFLGDDSLHTLKFELPFLLEIKSIAEGCSQTIWINNYTHIENPTPIPITYNGHIEISPSGCDFPSGSIVLYLDESSDENLQFEWSHGSTTLNQESIAAGIYTLTLTNDNECEETVYELTVPSLADFTVEVEDIDDSHSNCTSGVISLWIEGGATPYQLSWNNGNETIVSYGTNISNLAAGDYLVTITDATGCYKVESYTVGSKEEYNDIHTEVVPTICSEENGQISLYVDSYYTAVFFTIEWSNGDTGEHLSDLAAGTYAYTVTNALGCVMLGEVEVPYSEECSGSISGYVLDIRMHPEECVHDADAVGLAYEIIRVNFENGEVHYISTDVNGYYKLDAPKGLHTLSLYTKINEVDIVCPEPGAISLTLNEGQNLTDNNLYVVPITDLSIHSFIEQARPGLEFELELFYKVNYNSVIPEDIKLEIKFEEGLEVVSTSQEEYEVSGSKVTLPIENIGTLEEHKARVTFFVPLTFDLGDILKMESAISSSLFSESNSENNIDLIEIEVVDSYDPNAMTVTPPGIGEDGKIKLEEETFLYRIDFQNYGTAEAINIYVDNVVDPNLDMCTFEVLEYSHPMEMSYTEDRLLTFRFDDIWLESIEVDEAASQGYVIYMVNKIPGLEYMDQIKNTASIYFDFNEAVITNTEVNTFYDFSTAVENIDLIDIAEFEIIPNPTVSSFVIDYILETSEEVEIYLYDINGMEIDVVLEKTFQNVGRQIVKYEKSLPKGLYFITIRTPNGEMTKRLIRL